MASKVQISRTGLPSQHLSAVHTVMIVVPKGNIYIL